MTKKLHISDQLEFPVELVTQRQAILAKSGVGKSYTASVEAEEMLEHGQHIVVIDFTGVWWGLRSSASGKEKGYSILVLGGDHGDVPLEETAGEVIAEAIINDRFSAILDLSLFRKAQMHRFLTSFLETIYRKNREPIHLFCDEADAYAPQQTFGDDARTLGAMDDIVRRGRARGIGCTLITQRPASINKNVLTQCEMLTCLRMTHPRDIKAIEEWVDVHADKMTAQKMISDIPTLAIGTAWVWAPAWPDEEGIFKKIKVRQRRTFDSGATPKPGQVRKSAKVLAPVDVEKLGDSIKQTVEKTKENDPKRLKAEIQQLKAELAKRPEVQPEIVEKPVLDDAARHEIACFTEALGKFSDWTKANCSLIETAVKKALEVAKPDFSRRATSFQPTRKQVIAKNPVEESRPSQLTGGEKAIMICVASYPEGVSRESLTVFTGYKRSSRDAYLQRLKSRGFIGIKSDGCVYPEHGGIYALGTDFEPLPTGKDLQEYWLNRLSGGEREILEVIIKAYPESISRDQISEMTPYKRSSRDAYLQRLKSRMLIDVLPGSEVRASDNLF